MSDVDKALEHTLGLRFELGLFDQIEDQPLLPHSKPAALSLARLT